MSPNPQFHADSVKFTEEILNRKLHFFAVATSCSVLWNKKAFKVSSSVPSASVSDGKRWNKEYSNNYYTSKAR